MLHVKPRARTSLSRRWRGCALAVLLGLGCGEPRAPVAGFSSRAIAIVDTVPARGSDDVQPGQSLDLCLDGILRPDALEGFEVLLTSGGVALDTDVEVALRPYRAAGSRVALADSRWCDGSVVMVRPTEPMRAGATYRLRLRLGDYGWNAEPLDISTEGWDLEDGARWVFSLPFTVDPSAIPPDTLERPAPIGLDVLFETGQIFDPARGMCGCHQDASTTANRRLDLRSPAAAYADLLDDSAPQSTGFPLVSPGYPGASYLIQKLTANDEGDALHGVLGERMPRNGTLPHVDAATLAMWIATGAAVDSPMP